MPRRRRISSISRMSSSGSGDLADLGLARALLPLLLLLPLEEAVACAGTAGRWVPGSVAAVSSAAPALRGGGGRGLGGLGGGGLIGGAGLAEAAATALERAGDHEQDRGQGRDADAGPDLG